MNRGQGGTVPPLDRTLISPTVRRPKLLRSYFVLVTLSRTCIRA